MSKSPCCISNEFARDKKNYMRCSTRPTQLPPCEISKKKEKPGKENLCCGMAFHLAQQQTTEEEDEDLDELCAPPKKGPKKQKIDKDKLRCYTANLICPKLYLPGVEFPCLDRLKMKVTVCKGCKPILCSNRINVNCMPSEPMVTFSMLPECFEKELSEGITIVVVYNKKEIARGCYVLPESVILKMTASLQEVVHTADVELTCKGCTVGLCQLRLAMRMRCQSFDDDTNDDTDMTSTEEEGTDSCSSSSDHCPGLVDVDASSIDTLDMCESAEQLRPEAADKNCKKLIDMAGPYAVYECPENEVCLDVDIKAAPGPGAQYSFGSHLGTGNTNRMCPTHEPPKLKQMGVQPLRECPLCHEDVSWLPQISACPHCGYKPLPEFEEKDYDEKTTAKDILVTYFGNQHGENPKATSTGDSHCEPPKERSESFDDLVEDYKALKKSINKSKSTESKSCPALAKKSQRSTTSNLVNIFTELRDLFQASDADEKKKATITEICEDACKLEKSTRRRRDSKSPVKGCETASLPKLRKRRTKRQQKYIKSRTYEPVDLQEHRRLGHVHCSQRESKVPPHMGWLWTQSPLGQRPGWRPGAIRRSIRELMSYFLKDFPVDTIPLSKYKSYLRQKPPVANDEGSEKPEDLVQVPTLHIEKKHDEYVITLRPLKDAASLGRAANPYANMKPVQFRIVKNPVLKEVRDMKRCIKKMGYSKCTCHRSVMECHCRSFIEKKRLLDEVHKQCKSRDMEGCENDLVLSETTDSEAEFDFGVTPPAGLMHPERLKKTHTAHAETQYNENDWAMPTMFPHPPNAQVQYGGCVVGERKGRFHWIYGKGNVHQQPKPPTMRNPPKKKPKRAFPGAPLPREKGGFAAEVDTKQIANKRSYQMGLSHTADRLQRLNRAAYPPTKEQFQQQSGGNLSR